MTKQTQRLVIGAVVVAAVALGLVLFLLLRRGSDALTVAAPAPPRAVTSSLLPLPVVSTIAVRANVPIQEIKTLAETALTDYLRTPLQQESESLDYAIKLDLSTLQVTGDAQGALTFNVPFLFSGSVAVKKKVFGRVLQKREAIEGIAALTLTLRPTFHSDWRISAETRSDIFIQKAEIKILGIAISVRDLLTELVREKVLPKLEARIVDYITSIDVKSHVADLWARLHEPIVLNDAPRIALTVEPLEMLARQVAGDGSVISFSLGVKSYIGATIAHTTDEPIPAAAHDTEARTPTELPDLRFVESLSSGYSITAPIDISYTTLETLAKPHVEKSHTLKGVDTEIQTLSLYGSGTHLAAGVVFRMPGLGAMGQIYLLGTPIYDETAQVLSVMDFDYTLTTQGLLIEIAKVAGAGFFPNLRETIEGRLTFPLEARLDALREQLTAAIAERPIGSYVVLRGTVETMTPEALYLTQTGVRIPVRLQGALTTEIQLKVSDEPK